MSTNSIKNNFVSKTIIFLEMTLVCGILFLINASAVWLIFGQFIPLQILFNYTRVNGISSLQVSLITLLFLPVTYIFQRIHDQTLGDLGLRRPSKSWIGITILAIGLALLLQGVGIAIGRFLSQNAKPDLSAFEVNGVQNLLCWIAAGVIGGGFIEELLFRGFLLSRFEMLFEKKPQSTIISVILLTVLFGLVHIYQGLSGVIMTAVASLSFWGVYFWSQRNLWATILTHSCVNVIGFLWIALGI